MLQRDSGTRLLAACALIAVAGCERAPAVAPMFELLDTSRTGIAFQNRLPEDTAFNILNYLYYYNGGGVAAGDVNDDGLPDLYFTSNLGPNHLYLNRGGYRFEDVTASAGVADAAGWKTGVTMADVNGDGRLDIHVSAVAHLAMAGRNVLYVNNGDGTFTDRAAEYGLDYAGYTTQTVFFDYDGDGDLDAYLLNHATHADRGRGRRNQMQVRDARLGDRLYRNDGGHFTNVTATAGIYGGVDFGLGVVASDLNGDGCPDLYVANDFQEDDLLYYNQCDGTFTESMRSAMPHTSRFSMGVDAADFNNDGRVDVVTTDMLPERQEILQTSANESADLYDLTLAAGYHPQYSRNALQLNRGLGRFSDIGYLAGVAASDWSWAPLFADFDNDGRKDLFVSDGVYRRPNDLDYIRYLGNPGVQASLARGADSLALAALLQQMPSVPLANHLYRNEGGLRFTSVAEAWGLGQPGFSNGAVYVDLDNSGALDLVVNRINAPAAVYRNHARERTGNHYLAVRLRGSARGANSAGVGARVTVTQGASRQVLEQMPTRGFQSSVDLRLHFGLGASAHVDSLIVVWPDRRTQVLLDQAGDRSVILAQDSARAPDATSPSTAAAPLPLFRDVTRQSGVAFTHHENPFRDWSREPLMPELLSTQGPALAVGDANGDGLGDFYVGGAKWQPGELYLQDADGSFRPSPQPGLAADSLAEDVAALFFDANGDGAQDLYVVSGGNEFAGNDDPLQDRLYLNDGRGTFTRDAAALPRLSESGSVVAAGDMNRDGHIDLFIGRRAVARRYGTIPRSYMLENDGRGHFRDVTDTVAKDLARAGMVTSAAWLDYDRDGKLDLVVVGEWMPVRVFHQERGRLVDRSRDAGLAGTSGWWNSVSAADLNRDGQPDLVLGNLGLNSYIRASQDEPARLYVHDFAKNGAIQQILTVYRQGVSVPLASRDEIVGQIPSLRERFPTYRSFGASRVEDLFPASVLRAATVLEATTSASGIAWNQGNGRFAFQPLPVEAQFAPVNASVAGDFDGDGRMDLLVAGNFFGVPPIVGRYDASYGLLLRQDPGGVLSPVDMAVSNVVLDGQVRRMAVVRGADGTRRILVARNNDTLQVLQPLH